MSFIPVYLYNVPYLATNKEMSVKSREGWRGDGRLYTQQKPCKSHTWRKLRDNEEMEYNWGGTSLWSDHFLLELRDILVGFVLLPLSLWIWVAEVVVFPEVTAATVISGPFLSPLSHRGSILAATHVSGGAEHGIHGIILTMLKLGHED